MTPLPMTINPVPATTTASTSEAVLVASLDASLSVAAHDDAPIRYGMYMSNRQINLDDRGRVLDKVGSVMTV